MVKFKYPEFIEVFEQEGRIRLDIGNQETDAPDRVRLLINKKQAIGLKKQLEQEISKVEYHERHLKEQMGPLNQLELDSIIDKEWHEF
ncbi:MAG: hypothetical protein SCK28_05635 [Bacillota bacterium]|nr:hypothetical protein [Bacillota bacterium]